MGETLNQIQLFNHWMKRFFARYLTRKPVKGYTAEVDATDTIKQGIFKESQKNKPSPSSHLPYNYFVAFLDWTKFGYKQIDRSFIGWTNSMEPTIDYGDMVLRVPYKHFVKELGFLPVGQICIYRYGDMRIIHRYIGKDIRGNFIFKGDNNFRKDPPVKEEQIEDVMIGVIYTNDKLKQNQD